MAMGRLDEARVAYEKQIEINPRDIYSYNNLAVCFQRQGYWDKAVENLRKQLEINPSDQYATGNLPRALMRAGRWSQVEQAAEEVLKTAPSPGHRLNRALGRVCSGKAEDARKELDGAIKPPSIAGFNTAAYFLTECGKEPELASFYVTRSLDLFEATEDRARHSTMSVALAMQSYRIQILDTRGLVLFKEGNLEQAAAILEAALALGPDTDSVKHLAQVEWKLGRREQSLRHWKEAITLQPGRLEEVPPDLRKMLDTVPPLSSAGEWYSLPAQMVSSLPQEISSDQPVYFFIVAKPEGSIEIAREVDKSDPAAAALLPAIEKLRFPVIKVDGLPVPNVQLLRVHKDSEGKVSVARSISAEAIAIAAELSPADFPAPPPAPAPRPANQ
jgi:tetratricopeptide (TPR) repeat protein